jgi:hypothetical protein
LQTPKTLPESIGYKHMYFHYKPRERTRNSFVLVTGIAINYGYSQWVSWAIGLAWEQVNKEVQENAL